MQDALDPVEAARLEALQSFDVLGTPPEAALDLIVSLGADLFDAPMAFVSLIGRDTVWLKARLGLGRAEMPLSDLFGGSLLTEALAGPCVVVDAASDPRFRDHPLVRHPPHVRFYAGAPLVSAQGEVLGMLCVMDVVPRPAPSPRDLERIAALADMAVAAFETRRARSASRDAECLLGLAETVAGIGHWRIDIDTRELTWSDGVYRMYGVSRAAFRPTISGTLARCHPDDRDAMTSVIRRTVSNGLGFRLEGRIRRADGHERLVLAEGVCEVDRAGVVKAMFGVVQDVTDRASTEAALRDSETRHRLLAEQQDDRTAAAGAAAEAEAKARSERLADMSHELLTPLNGIIGFTQVLKRDGALGDERLRVVERIEDAGYNLLAIVGDVLEPSKLASGAPTLDSRPFSLPRLLEDAVALVKFEADRKGLDLVLDLPPVLPGLLVGDPARLRQVLLNLLSNAVKFTSAGAVRMSLSVEPTAAVAEVRRERGAGPPVQVTIVVEDSGVGIPAASIPKLFRRYEQADRSVARRFGGTGLGLAISKTLLEAMNGTIAVESSPGAGSRFSVSLPLPRSAERRPVSRGVRPRRPVGVDALKGRAILLAEDVALNRKLVQLMLAPLGAEVDVVVDGRAAVEAVRQRDYALVLMDMEMPILNGLEATRDIRALGGAHASLPIVALTANVFPEQLAQCRDAGMDDCLSKPFGPDELTGIALKWARGLSPAAAGPA